jgi:hypothetical protein
MHVGFYEPKNPRLFIFKILSNYIGTNLQYATFGGRLDYQNLAMLLTTQTHPFDPSLHALVGTN